MLCLRKTFARSEHDDSMNKKMPTTYDIKIAVAAYSIQRRVLKLSSTSSSEESVTPDERNLPASGRIRRRMEVTKVQLLQAEERKAAGKRLKDEIHGLRKEHGDIVIPERNGGITEADCLSEINTILFDWGLTNVKSEGGTHPWDDDLESMVSHYVQRKQEERKRRREDRSVS
ncbi:uncharacterized protein CCOS01_13006 [Colletotrichum costaricense]|uniref:Uncharacterized protein n=1 Tax=Colletotrichum costaricense TaxID=1209916 RepID=A0AAI9YMD7_9PEZI|nr:uncharacterized protein CCOS01_13006 [Colletotrichum costaricense]KAK1515808.1 hypothetical protein CCOS01_13006 [Colletotrichum costaricense]